MDAAAQRNPVVGMGGLNGARLLRVLVVTVAVLVAAWPSAAAASGGLKDRPPNLQPLWKGYPLDSGAGRVDARTTPANAGESTRHAPPAASSPGTESGGASPLVYVAAAGGIAALAAFVAMLALGTTLRVPQLTKGAGMSRFIKRHSDEDGDGSPGIADRAAIPTVDATVEHARDEAPAADAASIASHVQGVLKAAEDAAAHLLDETRARAAEIRREAERERASLIEAAQGEAAQIRAQADQERVAAASTRAEAERDAEAIRAEAERDASAAKATATARYEELLEDTEFAENRLRRLVGGLFEVAHHLDSLVGPSSEAEIDAEGGEGSGELSLVDALEPGGPTANAPRP